MKTEPVRVSAALEKASTLKDGSVRLVFDTQELDARKAADLFAQKNMVGWLIFAAHGTDQVVIPDEPPAEFRNQKSYSQRLRGCLYRLWEMEGKKGDSETFYQQKMETIIEWVKNKLERAA